MSKRALDDFSTFRPAPRVEKRGNTTRACRLFKMPCGPCIDDGKLSVWKLYVFAVFFFAQIQTNVSMQLVPRHVKVGKTPTTAEQNPRPCTRGVRSRVTCVDQVRFCRTKPCILTCAACKEIQVYVYKSTKLPLCACGMYLLLSVVFI